jgi:hypothetical protein
MPHLQYFRRKVGGALFGVVSGERAVVERLVMREESKTIKK